MSKYDIYLQDNSNVLKNKLGITDEAALDTAESMMVRTRMPVPMMRAGCRVIQPVIGITASSRINKADR